MRDLTPAQERAVDVAVGSVADAVTRHDWDYAENLLDLMFRKLGLDPTDPTEREREERGQLDA